MADHESTMRRHLDHGGYGLDLMFMADDYDIWRCGECHILIAECAHRSNSWDVTGENLTCDYCGLDGT